MNAYEEKRQARAERYAELSAKARAGATQAYEHSNRLVEHIPFGQPILVGHHSEKMHRNTLERSNNAMRKSIDLTEKAEYYERKAESAQNNHAISSDDPDAIAKLKDKLKTLEENREKIKAQPHEAYQISNIGQNIRTIKQRIEYLESQSKVTDSEELINGITVKVNKELNRVQLLFPSIPSVELREKMKSRGFKYSPTNQAWQRMISGYAIQLAKEIAKEAIV